jgi:hypothetical protein
MEYCDINFIFSCLKQFSLFFSVWLWLCDIISNKHIINLDCNNSWNFLFFLYSRTNLRFFKEKKENEDFVTSGIQIFKSRNEHSFKTTEEIMSIGFFLLHFFWYYRALNPILMSLSDYFLLQLSFTFNIDYRSRKKISFINSLYLLSKEKNFKIMIKEEEWNNNWKCLRIIDGLTGWLSNFLPPIEVCFHLLKRKILEKRW